MASHIPLVEDDRVIGLDGKPLAALPVNAWAGLPFEIHPHMRQSEVARRINPHPLVLVHQNSRGRSRIRSGRQVYDVEIAPGHVDIFAAQFHMDHGSWDCTPGQVLALEIDPQRARGFLRDDVPAPHLETRLALRDVVLERLFACVRSEVQTGCGSGRLFAESISLGVLSRLSACYAPARAPALPARRLTTRQLERTIAYIEAHLGADLGIAALAEQLGMSAFTFSRLFKATVGQTPHRFVIARRIARAEALLAGERSLSEIALATGFATQSHFTETFRRRTGRTPTEARRGR